MTAFRYIKIALLFAYLCMSFTVLAAPVYQFSPYEFRYEIQEYVKVNSANANEITIEKLVANSANDWHLNPLTSPNVVVEAGQNWFMVDLVNQSELTRTGFFVLRNTMVFSDVEIYLIRKNVEVSQPPFKLHRNNLWAGKIELSGYENAQLIIRIASDNKLNIPALVMSEGKFIEELSHSYFNSGTASGGLLFLALLAIIIFIASGYKSVLLLCAYFITRALLLTVLLGGNLYFLLPHLSELRGIELPILVSASYVFLIWFAIELFSIKKNQPKIYKLLRINCWVLLVFMPVSLQFNVLTNIYFSLFIHLISNALLLFSGVMLLKQGQRLALLFSGIISLQLLVGIGSLLFSQLAGEDFFAQSFTLYSVTFWLSALLMTFLVSRHFYHQVKDKQVAQLAALESATASKQAQEELLKLQQENQEQLEVRVQERTLELNIALQELESANHELAEKNTIDDLSGLYNRRHYDQKILAEYRRSKRNLTPLSLVIIDIDHFKRVNDDYGHQMGDHCIASVGRYIKQCLRRSSDLGFRYGGEEFCLLLPETDSVGAQALAEELRLAISNELITHQQQQLSLTISCGVSTYQQQKEIDPESLFAAADKALYKAKHNGRNQTQIESPTESLNYQEQINE